MTAIVAFPGLRGTDDFATDQRPKNFRGAIGLLYPNGMMPLTAISSMMKKESTDDPEFNWWTKKLATQAGAVTNIYMDADLVTAYVTPATNGLAGAQLYVKVALATVKEFRVGHTVLLRDESVPDVDCVAKVTAITQNGASSVVACKLLEDDDNSSASDLTNADRILAIGNVNAEGADRPVSLSYDPVKFNNYTQIFRTALSITRTARRTRLRTGPAYQELKREALEYHGIEQEKATLWGIATENTGDNGKPERTTQGMIPWIKENASANVFDYTSDSDYSALSWVAGGKDWLNNSLEVLFRYAAGELVAICGSGALLGIQKLAETYGTMTFQAGVTKFGMNVTTWITPFGNIILKTHPLFSQEQTNRNAMVLFMPKNLTLRVLDDTMFLKDPESKTAGEIGRDGTEEEFLTEAGYEFHMPEQWGYMTGFDTLNTA